MQERPASSGPPRPPQMRCRRPSRAAIRRRALQGWTHRVPARPRQVSRRPRPVACREWKRLPPGQRLERLGQLLGTRHIGIEQQWNDTDAGSAQAFDDLLADPVVRQVETASTLLVGDGEPSRIDDHEHRDAGIECMLKCLREVRSGFDAAEILEDVVAREVLAQIVSKPSHRVSRAFPAVADEDARSALRRTDRHPVNLHLPWPMGTSEGAVAEPQNNAERASASVRWTRTLPGTEMPSSALHP